MDVSFDDFEDIQNPLSASVKKETPEKAPCGWLSVADEKLAESIPLVYANEGGKYSEAEEKDLMSSPTFRFDLDKAGLINNKHAMVAQDSLTDK